MNQEFQYAFRMLRKDKAFAALAVVTLTIGTSLVITMFAVVNGIYFKGLPFPESNRLVHLERDNVERGLKGLSVTQDDYLDWQEQNSAFRALGAYRTDIALSLAADGMEARRFSSAAISPNFTEVLGVSPALGRAFASADIAESAEPVALISHRVWEQQFDRRENIVGQVVIINDEPTTLIGVMPPGFSFPTREAVWTPLKLLPNPASRQRWGNLQVFGRLETGVSLQSARAEFEEIALRLEAEHPGENAGIRPVLKPFLFEYSGGELQKTFTLMFLAVVCVLLIACANVTNLLLVRAIQRGKELAIRSALGATRARMIRQMLIESLLLSLVGTGLGLLLSLWIIEFIWNILQATQPPFWYDFSIDARVTGFVVLLMVLTGLLAGIIPALQASRPNVNAMLKDITRTATNFRINAFSRGLVVAQVALSCSLLIAAGLTLRTLLNLHEAPEHFETEKILTARLSLFEKTYPTTISRIQFFNTLEASLEENPGIASASVSSNPPGAGSSYTYFAVDNQDALPSEDFPFCRIDMVSDSFFRTYNVIPLAGNIFDYEDPDRRQDAVIVNESFIRRYLTGENPMGRRVKIHSGEPGWESNPWLTIIGVVPDLRMDGLVNDGGTPAGIYLPINQIPPSLVAISARVEDYLEPGAVAPDLRQVVQSLNPNLPAFDLKTYPEFKEEQTYFFKVVGAVFCSFGGVGVILAAIGIYGVMSFMVRHQSVEIGIRMALGADEGEILQHILKQGFWQLAVGMLFGIIMAVGITEVLDITLYEVAPNDPATFLSVVGILCAAGMAASYFPARKAAAIQPLEALRSH